MTDTLLALAWLHKYFYDRNKWNPGVGWQEGIDILDTLIKIELRGIKAEFKS